MFASAHDFPKFVKVGAGMTNFGKWALAELGPLFWQRRTPNNFSALPAFRLDALQRSTDLGYDLDVVLVEPLRDLHLFTKTVLARFGYLDGIFVVQQFVHRQRLEIMTYHFTNSHEFFREALGPPIGAAF